MSNGVPRRPFRARSTLNNETPRTEALLGRFAAYGVGFGHDRRGQVEGEFEVAVEFGLQSFQKGRVGVQARRSILRNSNQH
jgi:hypothetical protein